MKSTFKVFIITAAISIVFSLTAFGAAKNVTVTLPEYNITVNGIKIDNDSRDYPFINYRGITYFPMTYNDTRFLGITAEWNSAAGLKISKAEQTEGYVDTSSTLNKKSYVATTPSFAIEVNGRKIDNSKETYPILLFRNVTYFPVTWSFANDEFGWEYKFDELGLEINARNGYGLDINYVDIPLAVRDGDFYKGAFTAAGEYFYYEGENGIIYQSPVRNTSIKKKVYELPLWSHGESYVYAGLSNVNEEAFLTYHQGGAAVGTDYTIVLKEDGTNEIFSYGYLCQKSFGDTMVQVVQFPPPSANNLFIKRKGETEFSNIGDPDYRYGYVQWQDLGSSPSYDLYMVNDEIYVLAKYKPFTEDNSTGIHRVNINTGVTTRVADESAAKFIIQDNAAYFTDVEGYLYRHNLSTTGVSEKLTDFTIKDFCVLYGNIFYVSGDDKGSELFMLGSEKSLNPGGRVSEIITSKQFAAFIFEKDSKEEYKMMVFRYDGKNIFKTNQNIRFITFNNNNIMYYVKY